MNDKTCTKCGETKPLDEFNRDKTKPDGHLPSCKGCCKAQRGAKREQTKVTRDAYREANIDRLRAASAKWRSDNREHAARYIKQYRQDNRERLAESAEAYRDTHRVEIAEYRKRHYEDNRTRVAEVNREYREQHPEVVWAGNYRRQARSFGLPVVETPFTLADVLAAYGDACFYCGGGFAELDHAHPISRGGTHDLANVRPSCAACNRAKHDSTIAEWRSGAVPPGRRRSSC